MSKTIARGLFYAVAIILLLWTASLTLSFVSNVLPNAQWYVPLFALVVFDAGMIAWMKVYLDYAAGTGQRAVALVTCLFDFLGVGLMAMAEIFLGGQTLVDAPAALGELAIWGIGIWTIINVGSIIAFHLLSPDARQKMAIQQETDAIFDEALKRLTEKRAGVSGQLADRMAEGMLVQLVAGLAVDGANLPKPNGPDPVATGQAEATPVFFADNGQAASRETAR